jgi:hypothetical protein
MTPVTGRVLLLEFCVQPSTQHRPDLRGKQASAMLFLDASNFRHAKPWPRNFAVVTGFVSEDRVHIFKPTVSQPAKVPLRSDYHRKKFLFLGRLFSL